MDKEVVIQPTIGRQVWLWLDQQHKKHGQPFAATVVYVNSVRDINVHALDNSGQPAAYVGITLVQPGDKLPLTGAFCEWMPYQIGQAAQAGGAEGVVTGKDADADEQVGEGVGIHADTDDVELEPYQKRVVMELAELAERIISLDGFIKGDIYENLPPIERMLLTKQLAAQRDLAFLLESRLALWGIVRVDAL